MTTRIPAKEITGPYGALIKIVQQENVRTGAGVARSDVAQRAGTEGIDGLRPEAAEVGPVRRRP